VIAVSTGADSMSLLYAFLLLKDEYQLRITVAHVNHKKRKQSDEEEQYIREFSDKHHIQCYVETLKDTEYDNFQSYARQQRYQFFQKVMEETESDYLVLAHHAEDNIETILMRILRGSSLRGYSGMDEVMPYHGKLLIRPLMGCLKEELIAFLDAADIRYYQDLSNFEDTYTRNRIRKEIIPLLYKEDSHVHEKFSEFSETLKEASTIVDDRVQEFLNTDAVVKNDSVSFLKNSFLRYAPYLQNEILFYILKRYSLSRANIEEIRKLIQSEKKNIKVTFRSAFTFVKEYNQIAFYHRTMNTVPFDFIIDKAGVYKINDTISVNVTKNCDRFISNDGVLCYNSSMLPIHIRSRRPGDRILLESGSKKVKDLLIDMKIGILKREQTVIAEKDGMILAVLGIKKSRILKQIENKDILIKVEYNG
jgi:tRNA(Ile)-lysidine synthetase-like protein